MRKQDALTLMAYMAVLVIGLLLWRAKKVEEFHSINAPRPAAADMVSRSMALGQNNVADTLNDWRRAAGEYETILSWGSQSGWEIAPKYRALMCEMMKRDPKILGFRFQFRLQYPDTLWFKPFYELGDTSDAVFVNLDCE